jgi:tetratricopeptide (TPR) repeat protein
MQKKQTNNRLEVKSTPAVRGTSAKLKTSLGIIIAAFAFLIYAQTISFNYTLDDHPVTDQNKYTKMGFAGIPTLLKTDYWYGLESNHRGPVYRPASLVLFASIWQFFHDSPQVYHLFNVLFFACSCCVLFLTLCLLFENKFGNAPTLFPFVCSILYAAHPIHTEVVCNIKSMDEILCFLFGLLAITAFVKSSSKDSILYFILGGISFFISLLSKETGITFLLTIPLALLVFTGIKMKKLLIISIELLLILAIYLIIRHQVLLSVSMNTSTTYLFNSVVAAPDFVSREATVFYILLRYILLLIYPISLTCDYNYSMINIQSLSNLPVIAGILINVGLVIYALINLRKKSIVSFAILFYFITVAPVSNLFFNNGATMAERFMYMPSLGFSMLCTMLFIKLMRKETLEKTYNNLYDLFSMNSRLFMIVFGIFFLYSVKTLSRTMDWEDNATLFSHDVEISDKSATAHIIWGKELLLTLAPKETNPGLQKAYISKSLIEFDKALKIMDTLKFAGLYNNKGCALAESGRLEEAINAFQKEIDWNPNYEDAYKNIGSAYANLKQYSKALEYFNKALILNPSDAEVIEYINESKKRNVEPH